MKKRAFSPTEQTVLDNYPLKENGRTYHVKHPLDLPNGKWVAVRVSKDGGYFRIDKDIENNPTIVQFDSEQECQKACDIHNNFHFNPRNNEHGKFIIDAILKASFQ